jgi:hypothetical protein
MRRDLSLQLSDVKKAFDAVPDHGLLHELSVYPGVDVELGAQSHVQGIAKYGHYWIASCSQLVENHGYIFVFRDDDPKFIRRYDTPHDHLDHPCGLQVCGDYLLLATEPINGSPQSKILTYDLSQLTNDKFPDPHYGIVDLDEKAGAVAVTSMKWPVGPDYVAHLVAVHDNENLRFYVSDGGPLGTCKFHEEFRAKIPSVGTESIALFTETSGDIYLLLLHAKSQATVHDKATLLKVHIAGKFVEDLGKTRHFYTHHGGLKGAMGVHFRYGAGARAVAHDAMELLATQMHLVGRKFALNTFTGPTKPLERLPARVNLPRHDG